MAFIEKVSETGSVFQRYNIKENMHCGNIFHAGFKHKFTGLKKEADILHFIFSSLRAKVTDVQKEGKSYAFIFEHKRPRIHRQLFKICRYVRHVQTFEILKTMKKAIEAGVKPYNAIVI